MPSNKNQLLVLALESAATIFLHVVSESIKSARFSLWSTVTPRCSFHTYKYFFAYKQ